MRRRFHGARRIGWVRPRIAAGGSLPVAQYDQPDILSARWRISEYLVLPGRNPYAGDRPRAEKALMVAHTCAQCFGSSWRYNSEGNVVHSHAGREILLVQALALSDPSNTEVCASQFRHQLGATAGDGRRDLPMRRERHVPIGGRYSPSARTLSDDDHGTTATASLNSYNRGLREGLGRASTMVPSGSGWSVTQCKFRLGWRPIQK